MAFVAGLYSVSVCIWFSFSDRVCSFHMCACVWSHLCYRNRRQPINWKRLETACFSFSFLGRSFIHCVRNQKNLISHFFLRCTLRVYLIKKFIANSIKETIKWIWVGFFQMNAKQDQSLAFFVLAKTEKWSRWWIIGRFFALKHEKAVKNISRLTCLKATEEMHAIAGDYWDSIN